MIKWHVTRNRLESLTEYIRLEKFDRAEKEFKQILSDDSEITKEVIRAIYEFGEVFAVRKAGQRAKGSILASDAFFPKPDAIFEAHKAGIKAIIQPGGSIKDKDVIQACDECKIAMLFTGMRHFKH